MSERSVRNWSPLPSEKKKDRRRQRTRPDPLAGVWEQDIEPLLRVDIEGVLSASTWSGWTGHPRFGRSAHIAATDGVVRCTSSRSIHRDVRRRWTSRTAGSWE